MASKRETFGGGIFRFSDGVATREIRIPKDMTRAQTDEILRRATGGRVRCLSKSELCRLAVQREAEAARRRAEEDKLAAEIAEAGVWARRHGGKHALVIAHALNHYLGADRAGEDE